MSNKSRAKDWLITVAPILLTTVSILFMLVRSFQYANILPARMDESLFLYKGYLFATGAYKPFEPYGPWTNKNPLAFLIPGWLQLIFGPGLRTGRIVSIMFGVLTLVAVWIIVRRMTKPWLATLAVVSLALNPFYSWLFAQFISQSLTTVLLAWALVFTLGKNRSKLEIILGTLLSVLIVQVRQNMLPVPFLLILYVYWENGKKIGFISLLTAAISFFSITAFFLPDIIRNYLAVIPGFIQPIVKNIIYQPDGTKTALTDPKIIERILSFTQGVQTHLLELIGFFFSTSFLFRRNEKQRYRKVTIFLWVTFFILLVAHMWASLVKSYCIFGFSNYLGFFGVIGVILLAITIEEQGKKSPKPFSLLCSFIFIIILGISIGFSIHPDIGHSLLDLQVPRITNMRIQPGSVALWTLLANKYGATYDQLEILIPTFFGLIISVFVIVVVFLIGKLKKSRRSVLVNITSGFILLASPLTFYLTEIQYSSALKGCSHNIIDNYEEIGAHIDSQIDPESKVWLWAVSGQVVLSYTDDIQIYPPQLNNPFNYFMGGTSEELFKYGFWNENLALEWLLDCDYAIVENTTFSGDIVKWIDPDLFDELAPTITIDDSNTDDYFRIFRRK